MNHAKETLRISLKFAQGEEAIYQSRGRIKEADIYKERQESFLQALALLDCYQSGHLSEPETFEGKIAKAINAHSLENGSDTPDFILAEYLKRCLENFDLTLARRKAYSTLECDEVSGTEDDDMLDPLSPPSEAHAYRILENGETIQPGDEIHPFTVCPAFATDHEWEVLKAGTMFIGAVVGYRHWGVEVAQGGFRRKVKD